ncbi:MAG: GNAT family N-acetyltransferase [Sneathiella sp.]
MRLETERLVLRPFCDEDLPRIIKYGTKPEFYRYLPIDVKTEETIRTFMKERMRDQREKSKPRVTFAVAPKETDEIIGTVRLGVFDAENGLADIGYAMDLTFQGNGYMTEAVRRMIRFGFSDLYLAEIWATVDKENIKSWKLMERLGMERALKSPEALRIVGGSKKDYIYQISADRF